MASSPRISVNLLVGVRDAAMCHMMPGANSKSIKPSAPMAAACPITKQAHKVGGDTMHHNMCNKHSLALKTVELCRYNLDSICVEWCHDEHSEREPGAPKVSEAATALHHPQHLRSRLHREPAVNDFKGTWTCVQSLVQMLAWNMGMS
eukprot:6467938-Amphidinium_carterae.1